jgi:hypothetical protein
MVLECGDNVLLIIFITALLGCSAREGGLDDDRQTWPNVQRLLHRCHGIADKAQIQAKR